MDSNWEQLLTLVTNENSQETDLFSFLVTKLSQILEAHSSSFFNFLFGNTFPTEESLLKHYLKYSSHEHA